MGASLSVYWRGITPSQRAEQPGFCNDDAAWGQWIVQRESEPAVRAALESLGCAALLTFTTDGIPDDEVDWVSPSDLKAACARLCKALRQGVQGSDEVVESYSLVANGVGDAKVELIQDLGDISRLASFASALGVEEVTLEVNW